jgi:hypothetical protein
MAEGQAVIAVQYLGKITFDIGTRRLIQDGPQGTRALVPVLGGRFEGPKLRAALTPPAGDWITMRPDGTHRLDVRVTWATDDGAVILMTYNGIGHLTESGGTIRMAPLFETGDARYAWLNRLQAVGIGGRTGEERVEYEIYALL